MPNEKREEEERVEENVFKLTILIPVIQYFQLFTESQHNLSPDEFLKAIYAPDVPKSNPCSKPPNYYPNSSEVLSQKFQIPPTPLQKPIAKLFFEIIRLRPFLTNVVSEFGKRRKHQRNQTNISQTSVIIYVLIYRSSTTSINDAIDCLVHLDNTKMIFLLSFILETELPSWFYIVGCKLFDVDFVEQKILQPFLDALPVLQIIFTKLLEIKRPKMIRRKVTVPIQMNVLKHPRKIPDPPVCTREKVSKIPVQPVPKTLYKMPEIDSKIAVLREKHRVEAVQRLKDANAKAPACFQSEKSRRYQRIFEEIAETKIKNQLPITAKKIPVFKNVTVKKTITTILREEAIISNSEVKEVAKLQELMKGSFDPGDVQRVEEEMRRYEKEENMRNIEEKHLSGLISYEESLLAKQQLFIEAKELGDRVRSEREELNARLEKYRLEETEKLKRIVEKCHEAEQAAKNSYNFMVNEKRQKAAEVAEESRRIKVSLLKKKEEELLKKLEIIREIKSFQTSQGCRVKEFDPTETGKLGLMCEMSLAELKEKLLIAKRKWHDELMARKKAVKERRNKQKYLVECAQKTINEYRISKQSFQLPSSLVRDDSKIFKTPKLEALRRKLEERRMKRFQKISNSSSQYCSSISNKV